ncbi:hypothetical protein DFH08DRAFT_412424 [Mycena albidolilacea]|uniref:Uncharacterized protein n=1 Tax=Mycena albidolilacea TaxID=1033008 RepID=A0AAD7AIA8_9AGAR|nr:hypothetical protein DFH08DRAFT_412424 [Mycena albidolilacea]
MTQWCSSNWGDLLQPAPLSIALLGSILIIASSTDDFSLDSKAPPGCPPFEWKYALRPDSFKTCLQQMVNDGFEAFGTADTSMESIKNNTSQMPGVITTLIDLVLHGTIQDIDDHFLNQVNALLGQSQRCLVQAQKSTDAFHHISGLAQEMVLACTYTAGNTEKALAQNKIQLEVLALQEASDEDMVKQSKANAELMKNSYTKAEVDFHQALDDVPSGWDLVGMQVVESLTGLVVSAGNAAISMATIRSQAATAGLNAFSSLTGTKDPKAPATPALAPVAPTTSPNGVSSQPNAAALNDPGTLAAQHVLDQATNIKMLLTGGAGGKPDWDKIRGAKSGAAYVQARLTSLKDELPTDDVPGPVSEKLLPLIDDALKIIQAILDTENSVAAAEDTSLDAQGPPTDQLIQSLQSLVHTKNLLVGQPPNVANGPAVPQTPAAQASTGAAKLAVENAKMKVDQTRSQLEASRASFEKASDRLVAQQKEMTETIGKLTTLKLTSTNLEHMLPVLTKAVGAFTNLRAQFSQLVQFFEHICNLLQDIMVPSIKSWTDTLKKAAQSAHSNSGVPAPRLAGISVSLFTRDLIYRGCQTPLKVVTLANKISTTYGEISQLYIMPAQGRVGSMMKFADDNTTASKDALIAQLTKDQAALSKETQDASAGISQKVQEEQQTYQAAIDTRLQTLDAAFAHLPALKEPVPPHIQEVSDAHVADTDKTKELQASVDPTVEEYVDDEA